MSQKCHTGVIISFYLKNTMKKVSIIRVDKDGQRFYRLFRFEELVRTIKDEKFYQQIKEYREVLPYLKRDNINQSLAMQLNDVPFVCFSSEIVKQDGKEVIILNNPLILLTISNLRTSSLVADLKRKASTLP